jgi:hypothetical protein
MSTALSACDATSSEHTLQSFTALSLKPLLQFITTECLASPPSSALNLVDFVLQLLEANKDKLLHPIAPVVEEAKQEVVEAEQAVEQKIEEVKKNSN